MGTHEIFPDFRKRTVTMNTRLRTRLIPLLAGVLLSQQAAAIEEVVVYGTDTSLDAEIVAERIAEAMSDHVTAFNDAQKNALEAEMARLCEQKILIAAATLPTRG
jgi:hypothetical protein